MKVVKASVDLATWTLPVKCESCKSDLEVEAGDIKYRYQSDGYHYFCNCVLCNASMHFSEKQIPKIVQQDTIAKRAVKVSSAWD
jgi:hypothetical protein